MVSRIRNPKYWVYYTLSLPTELSSRGPQYLTSNNTFLSVVNMLQKFIRMHIGKFELQLAPQQNNHRSLGACLNWVMELRTHFLNSIEKIDVMIYHS